MFLRIYFTIAKQYLKVSNANMEEGSMRLEPNISLTKIKGKLPNYKIEVKNINSFKYVKRAIDYEIKRQEKLLDENTTLRNETRGFNENKNITFSQRSKEDAKDYRYFPEPDIPPFTFTEKDFSLIKIPELPYEKFSRYLKIDNLTEYQATILTKSLKKANLYEKLSIKFKNKKINSKIANFIINKVTLKDTNIEDQLKKYLELEKSIPENIILKIKEVFEENPKPVKDYKSGKENAIYFLIGKIVQKTEIKLDIDKLKTIIIDELKK